MAFYVTFGPGVIMMPIGRPSALVRALISIVFAVLVRFVDNAGEALFLTGEIAPGIVVRIKGSVRVTRRDPLGHGAPAPIVEQGPGEFAEVGQLSRQPAFVDVHAVGDVEALLIPSEMFAL
jgi:CRP-like cAMP-binding protein